MKRHILTVLIILSAALALTIVHYSIIDRPFLDARMQLHSEIIDGTSVSPYRYRVLIPFIAEGLIRFQNVIFSLPAWSSFSLSYLLIEAGLFLILLTSIYVYLRQWFGWAFSIAGIMALVAAIPLTFLGQYFQPWSYLETALLALVLVASRSRHKVLFGAVFVLLASLNRESGIFTAMGFFLVTFDFKRLFSGIRERRLDIDWRGLLTGMGLLMIWLFVFLSLHFLRGNSPQMHSLVELWILNTKPNAVVEAGLNWLAFFGLLWAFAVPGLRMAPEFFKKLVWLVPFYLVTILAWGIWSEVRLLLPIYVVLLPPGLLFFEKMIGIQEPA